MTATRYVKPAVVMGALTLFVLSVAPPLALAADHRELRRGAFQGPQAVGPNSLTPKAVAPNSLVPKATLPTRKKTLPMRQTPLTDTSPALQKVKPGAQVPKGSITEGAYKIRGISPGAHKALAPSMKKIGGIPAPGMESMMYKSQGMQKVMPSSQVGGVAPDDGKPAEFEPAPGAFGPKGGMALPGSDRMEEVEEEQPQTMPSPVGTKGAILGGGPVPGPGPTEGAMNKAQGMQKVTPAELPSPGGAEQKGIIVIDAKPGQSGAPGGAEEKGIIVIGAKPGQGGAEEKGIIIINNRPYVPASQGTSSGLGGAEEKGIIIINNRPYMPAPQGASAGPGGAQ